MQQDQDCEEGEEVQVDVWKSGRGGEQGTGRENNKNNKNRHPRRTRRKEERGRSVVLKATPKFFFFFSLSRT